MTARDYTWLAGVVAALRYNKGLTKKGMDYLVERLAHANERFDVAKFYYEYRRQLTMLGVSDGQLPGD